MARQASSAQARRSISPDSPRKRIKDRRRAQLIEANIASIAQHGLAETTITHVSEAAGMSRGIINFYFDSKETMMRETLDHLLEEQRACWQAALEKASEGSSGHRLEAIISALFSSKICTRKKLAVWSAFVAHAATHAPYRYRIAESVSILRHTLEELLAAQGAEDQHHAAERLLALVEGLWMRQILSESTLERREMVELCLSLHRNRPAAPKRKPSPAEMLPSLPRPALHSRRAMAELPASEEEAPVVADLFAALACAP
jgi:TetR/AcrR family transcriptional repressor of bet genes